MCAFTLRRRRHSSAWIRYSPLYMFPPCNHERSHTDNHNGADALALRVHQKDKHVYTTNHDSRNTKVRSDNMDSEERDQKTPGGPLSWNPKLPQSSRCHRFYKSECNKYTGDLPQITLCYKDCDYGSLPQWPSKQRAGVVRCKNNNARNLNHATEKITNNRCALQWKLRCASQTHDSSFIGILRHQTPLNHLSSKKWQAPLSVLSAPATL